MARLALFACLLLLVACAATPATPAPAGTVAASRPPPTSIATPHPPTTPATPWPMLSLSYRQETRTSPAISLYWRTGRSVEAVGRPDPSRMVALRVPIGETLTLVAPAMPPPTRVEIEAVPVIDERVVWATPAPLPTWSADAATTFRAAWPPGEYCVLVAMVWGIDEASYAFRLLVVP